MSVVTKRLKWLKWTAGITAGLFLLVLLAAAGSLALLRTETGQRSLAALISRLVSSDSLKLELQGLGGRIPWEVQLQGFTLADAEGVWLEGNELLLSLEPADLFRGRLHLPEIRLKSLRLDRIPQSTGQADGGFNPDDLKFPPVQVDRLALESLELGPTLSALGRAYTFTGRWVSLNDEAAVELNLDDGEKAFEALALKARWLRSSGLLGIDLRFHDGPDGLLKKLLGLPSERPVSLSLTGHGPLRRWPGILNLDWEENLALQTDLLLSLNDGLAFELKGSARAGTGLLPEKAAEFSGREAAYGLSGRLSGEYLLTVDKLNLSTETAELSLSGSLDLNSLNVDGRFDLTPKAPEPLLARYGALVKSGAQLICRFKGALYEPELHLKLTSGPAAYPPVSAEAISLELDARPSGVLTSGFPGLEANGRLLLNGLKHPGYEHGDETGINFSAVLDSNYRLDIKSLDLKTTGLTLSGCGTLVLDSLKLDMWARADLDEPAWVEGISSSGLTGRLRLNAEARGDLSRRTLASSFSGRLSNIKGLPEEASALLGGPVEISGLFDWDGDLLAFREVELRSASLLKGGGDIDLGRRSLAIGWTMDVAGLEAPAAGYGLKVSEPVRINGRLAGTFDDFSLDAGLAATTLEHSGLIFENLAANLKMKGLPSAVAGSIDLSCSSRGGDIKTATDFSYSAPMLSVERLTAAAPGVSLTAGFRYDASSGLTDGRAALEAESLKTVSMMLDLPVSGTVKADVDLSAETKRQKAVLRAAVAGLDWDGMRMGRAELRAQLDDLLAVPAGEAVLDLKNLRYQDYLLEEGRLEMNGRMAETDFTARLQGKAPQFFLLNCTGTAGLNKELLTLDLKSLSGRIERHSFRLLQPALLRKDGDRINITGLELRMAGGRLKAEAAIDAVSAALAITADRLPLSPLNMFSPVQINGLAGGRIDLQGPLEAPVLDVNLVVSDFRPALATGAKAPAAELKLTGRLAQGRLSAQASVEGLGPRPGSAEFDCQAFLKLRPFKLDLPADSPVRGRITSDVDLGIIPLLLALDDQNLSGLANADATIGGTLGKPRIEGTVALDGGRYENIRIGAILENIKADIGLEGDRLTLKSLKATDGAKGRINAEGGLSIDAEKKYPFDLAFRLTDAQLVRLDIFSANTSGALTLNGDMEQARLEGRLLLAPAELRVPENLPPSLVELDVTEINTEEGAARKQGQKAGDGYRFAFAVDVAMRERFYVRGRGLDSEWRGNLSVGGTAEQPRITGELQVIRGKFVFLDRGFNLTQGTLLFDGSSPPAPLISLTGEATIQSTTARVRLTGLAASPKIELSSDPYLPSDEVLALILFGRSLSSISPLQALRLAQAVNKLAGGKGPSLDIMGMTREILHVDDIDIRQQETGGGATVGVGKYLAENIYLRAETGVAGSIGGRVSVEVELTPHLSLETEVGSDSQGGLGLNWKIDY